MQKIKKIILFIHLITTLHAFGQEAYHEARELSWDEQEEMSFDIFNQKLNEAYNELSGKIKQLVNDHKAMVEVLIELNPDIAVVYTLSLKEFLDNRDN